MPLLPETKYLRLVNKYETPMDGKFKRRQTGAMLLDSQSATVRTVDRINVRLPAEVFEAMDAARGARPGHISRNTWMTDAIEEKLTRERVEADERKVGAAHA